MESHLDPAELLVKFEPGMSDREMESMMHQCARARAALDEFIADDISESDLCDILQMCLVNVDSFAQTVNYNLDWLGFPRGY